MGSIKVDFVGLNTLIYDPIIVTDIGLENTASIGYTTMDAVLYRNTNIGTINRNSALVALNLHRNGPYGYPTFKQVRNADKPIVKYYKKNSIFPYITDGGTYTVATEPAVVYRNHALQYDVNTADNVNRIVKISYGNNITFFANGQTDIDHDINVIEYLNDEIYDKFKDLYLDSDVETPISSFNTLNYSKGIYPADVNNIGDNRTRPSFANAFWKDSRDERTRSLGAVKNKFGFANTLTQSMWAMDAESDFATNTDTLFPVNMSPSAAGCLQNYETHIHSASGLTAINSALNPRALYSLKHTVLTTGSVVGRSGIVIPETGSSVSIFTIVDLFGGNALWQAGSQAGVYSATSLRALGPGSSTTFTFNSIPKNPFYNSYEEYADIIRFKAKGYTTVPEFRISENYEKLISGISLNVNNDLVSESMFDLTGGIAGKSVSSDSEFYSVYSFSDFVGEDLNRIVNDHNTYAIPTKIKIKAKAIMKLLPYDGFYPAERTVQIAEEFKTAYLNAIDYTGQNLNVGTKFRTFMAPFFAPGLMYNSIKSGLAVDFPYFSGSFAVENIGGSYLINSGAGGPGVSTGQGFDGRIPFEALLNPEAYLDGQKIIDMFPSPSASMNVTGTLDASSAESDKYRMMMENFISEVPNFFLSENKFSTILSNGDDQFTSVKPNTQYGLRVKLFRSAEGSNSPTGLGTISPQDGITSDRRETFTMYSRPTAFGPPSIAKSASPIYDSRGGYNFPFTPGYYHGEAWADIIYDSDSGATPTPSLEQIINSASVYYWRVDPVQWVAGHGLQSQNLVNVHAMQISASLNLFGTQPVEKDIVGSRTSPTSDADQWVISPKFETPMLNFNSVSATIPTRASASVPRGMWHQYGTIPNNANTGVFMQISEIPYEWAKRKYTALNVYSLSDIVGFDKTAKRLGDIGETKEIKEAMVVVPFTENNGERNFITVDRDRINTALGDISALNQAGDSIQGMVDKMQQYYIPPEFDFISNETIDPIAMYFFEFSHVLDKQDLADIWQNLPPKIAREFGEQEVEIEHDISITELMGEVLTATAGGRPSASMRDTLQNLRFMVFKVKQKSATSYSEQVYTHPGFYGSLMQSSTARMNWPYDFFSLVEYSKVDFGLEFAPVVDSDASVNSSGANSMGVNKLTGTRSGAARGTKDMGFGTDADTSELTGVRSDAVIGAKDMGFGGSTPQTDTSKLTGTGYGNTTERQSGAGSRTTSKTSTTKKTTPGSGGRSR